MEMGCLRGRAFAVLYGLTLLFFAEIRSALLRHPCEPLYLSHPMASQLLLTDSYNIVLNATSSHEYYFFLAPASADPTTDFFPSTLSSHHFHQCTLKMAALANTMRGYLCMHWSSIVWWSLESPVHHGTRSSKTHRHDVFLQPFGMPHVNPTIPTWGAGDYTTPYVISPVSSPHIICIYSCIHILIFNLHKIWFWHMLAVVTSDLRWPRVVCSTSSCLDVQATVQQSGYSGVDNEIGSPNVSWMSGEATVTYMHTYIHTLRTPQQAMRSSRSLFWFMAPTLIIVHSHMLHRVMMPGCNFCDRVTHAYFFWHQYFIPYDGKNGPDDGHQWLQVLYHIHLCMMFILVTVCVFLCECICVMVYLAMCLKPL